MKRMSKKTILGFTSIILGFLLNIMHIISYFFIFYFTSLGWADYGSSIGLNFLLTFGGVMIFINYCLGSTAILGFIVGNIIDRIIVCGMYGDFVSFGMILFPAISSLIMAVIWVKNREKHDFKNIQLIIISLFVLFIIFFPKLFCDPLV